MVNRNEADRYWHTAGDRVLLYLRCLNFPAPQALELALEALKEAERNVAQGSGNSPIFEAMQALHQLLSQQNPVMSTAERCGALIPPSPPIQRLSMVPEGLASGHLRSLLTGLLTRFR